MIYSLHDQWDREHLWHPYTSTRNPLPTYKVKRAEGVEIELVDGTRLIDGMSSWWSVAHGYNNPRLNMAAKNQLDKMSHVMFGGFTHDAAIKLGEKLLQLAPDGMNHIFYADSGSVAIEVAMKMAIQAAISISGNKDKTNFATILGGYHGDTWNAMSVCDPVTGMHGSFGPALPVRYFAPRPKIRFGEQWDESDFAPMKSLLQENHDKLAAVILEPIVQGAGGMWFYHPEYLNRLREECDRLGVLIIYDEIATGFWRTGRLFAQHYAPNSIPDIMTVGKALTGGYMTMGAVLATSKIADAVADSEAGVIMHGPTFMANPLACAVALESMRIFEEQDMENRVMHISRLLIEGLAPSRECDKVDDVRVCGAIGVIETKTPVDVGEFQKQCVKRGVWIRPFGKNVYIMPPYIITDDQLRYLCTQMVEMVKQS